LRNTPESNASRESASVLHITRWLSVADSLPGDFGQGRKKLGLTDRRGDSQVFDGFAVVSEVIEMFDIQFVWKQL